MYVANAPETTAFIDTIADLVMPLVARAEPMILIQMIASNIPELMVYVHMPIASAHGDRQTAAPAYLALILPANNASIINASPHLPPQQQIEHAALNSHAKQEKSA